MTGLGWLVVGVGAAVVGWLVYKMNQVTPASTTNYKPKVDAPKLAAPAPAKQAAKAKTARKAPVKKPAAKKKAK